ncbi:sugar transferase [Smaragdicoccus niigatensis]|uniref:sugar transferase n=1 Tax=Smaragdicoccus niigatensis TaxID=359359 RepID=UPI00036BA623|nr:sugar transferase [Smaragdicoccus niigatensis]
MAIRELGVRTANWPRVSAGMRSEVRITRPVRIGMVLVAALAESGIVFAAVQALAPASTSAIMAVSLFVMLVATRRSRDRLNLFVLDDLPSLVAMSSAAAFIAWLVGNDFGSAPAAVVGVAIATSFAVRSFSYVVRRRLQASRRLLRNTVIVGGGLVAAELAASMEANPSLGLRPVAMLDDFPRAKARSSDVPVRPMEEFEPGYIQRNGIDVVVVAFSGLREPDMLCMLRQFDHAQCDIYIVPRLFEYASISGDMDHIRGIPLARVRRLAHRTLTWKLKRASSFLLSALTLTLLSPVLAVVALAVWLEDRSAPVLFRQVRITENASEFTILKFRSMKPANENESATKWNIANDARLGRLGKFLRKTSLDELPQLFNVLKGDMDLVGPRPERPHFVQRFSQDIPGYGARHRIPAGLTGWAAIHGLRGDTSLFERAVYDNYYIENWSLWLDFKIMIRTVLVVFKRTGG